MEIKLYSFFCVIPAIAPFFTVVPVLMNLYIYDVNIRFFVMAKYTYSLKLWKVLRSQHVFN